MFATDFHHQAHTDYNVERIMCARAGDLAIWEVRTPFEVRDNDGAERVVEVRRDEIAAIPCADMPERS